MARVADSAVNLLTESPVTMPDMFKAAVTRSPRHIALRWKEDGQWKDMSYSQYYKECISAAKAFIKVNLPKMNVYVDVDLNYSYKAV